MDLQSQAREVSVGVYSLDLLARDEDERQVVIENQLEKSDHSHLGQVLTYAAGLDASTIVWIAKEFQDEHRKALDFLNDRTGKDTKFFGVAVELWKIGTCGPAVKFDLTIIPKDWAPPTEGRAQGNGGTEVGERYRAFFQPLLDTLHKEHRVISPRQARTRSWYSFSAGAGLGASYGVNFARGGIARVEVYIDNGDEDWNKRLFDQLEEIKEEIESEIGGEFDWQRLNDRRACRISAVRPGSIADDEETLEEISKWMIDRLLAFKRVFGPRLTELVE